MLRSIGVSVFTKRFSGSILAVLFFFLGLASVSSIFNKPQQAAGVNPSAVQSPVATIQFGRSIYGVREGETGAGVTLSVVRTGSTVGAVSVAYGTTDGTAIGGSDYSAVSGVLNFAPGESVKAIVVPVFNDGQMESNETFSVGLNPPVGADLGSPSNATVIIANSSTAPSIGQIQFSTPMISASEAVSSVTVGVARVNGASGPLSVTYSMADSTAISPGDYTSAAGTLNWGNGDTSIKLLTIPIVRDLLTEGDESFQIGLSSGTLCEVVIADDGGTPQPGKFKFEFSNYRIIEGGGQSYVYLNVLRTDGSNGSVEVAYTTVQGTATTDFWQLQGH